MIEFIIGSVDYICGDSTDTQYSMRQRQGHAFAENTSITVPLCHYKQNSRRHKHSSESEAAPHFRFRFLWIQDLLLFQISNQWQGIQQNGLWCCFLHYSFCCHKINSGITIWKCHYLSCVLHNKMDLDMQLLLFTIRFVSTNQNLIITNKYMDPQPHCFSELWRHMRHLKPPTQSLWLDVFICTHAHKVLNNKT